MTVGEKIKYYRELRGISQETLASLSKVSVSTLRKYEIGNRNPKIEQLQKIANGLQISINALSEINIQSVDEIAPYLFAIAKVGGIEFIGEKDENDKYIAETVSIKFKSDTLRNFIKEWADRKSIIDNLRLSAVESPDEKTKEYLINRADEIEKEIELRMIDSPRIVDSTNETKKIRIHPNNS